MSFERYGLAWPNGTDDLQVEMACVQRGGKWKGQDGKEYGLGLSHHYERMRNIMWPHLDVHRWHILCRDEILKNKVTVLMGCKSSGKTHSAAWVYLCEYLCFPQETCVLVSSTDLRGLELRVWGEVKSLFQMAKDKFDYLPGFLIDSKHAISTDDVSEGDNVRDLRKGMIGIPCVQNGKFIGLSKWVGIKQKRMRLIADEACFPAGTMVDTPTGPRPIETIRPGDSVSNVLGSSTVRYAMNRKVNQLVRITAKDGRQIVTTPTHPFFTQKGWVCACELNQSHYMVSQHESMQILRHTNEQQNFLQSTLRREIRNIESRASQEILHQGESGQNWHSQSAMASRQSRKVFGYSESYEGINPRGKSSTPIEGHGYVAENRPQTVSALREWDRTNRSGENSAVLVQGEQKQLCSENRDGQWKRIPTALQVGCSSPEFETGNRMRWEFPQYDCEARTGCQENDAAFGSWVDCVEIQEQEDFGTTGSGEGGTIVYNLQIERHPSYSVNGFLVHNSMMGAGFLSAFANLDGNEDFRAIILGNPNDPMDPLGRAAEPRDGWTRHLEPTKTEVWDTKFMGGRCVNLIGTDSPNFDFPANEPTRYKYLISREKIANTLSFFAKDTAEYYTQCVGSMKVGVLSRRVITRDLCKQFNAMEPVIWSGQPLTKIGGLDAAYGGDRCVGGHIEFGQAVDGKIVIHMHPPQIVPLRIKNEDKKAEDQIAEWVRDYCERNRIPPENFYHDSTGRGSLGTSLSRIWSAACNPVEFGGSATSRIVALGLYVMDPKTHERRLKLCSEHYSKFVTELWFAVAYTIEAGQFRGLTEEVMDEGCMREWDRTKNDKIEIESKIDMKDRVGRSPDLFDWLSICIEGARRRGFKISKLANEEEAESDRSWWEDIARKRQRQLKQGNLNYAA